MSDKKPAEEKTRDIKPFGLRMLPDLKERIAETAEENGRSLNAEIVARLEESLGSPDIIRDLREQVARLQRQTEDAEGNIIVSIDPLLQHDIRRAAKKFADGLGGSSLLSTIELIIGSAMYEVDRLQKLAERQRVEVERLRNRSFGGRAVTAQVDLLSDQLAEATSRAAELEQRLGVAIGRADAFKHVTLSVLERMTTDPSPQVPTELLREIQTMLIEGSK